MQDHEFEKQVHQRMEEMSIPPSDAVWAGVEQRLHAGNKRKRWIVWFPFLFIALSICGYVLYNPSSDRPGTSVSKSPATNISNNPANTNTEKQEKSPQNPLVSLQPSDNTPTSTQGLDKNTDTGVTASIAGEKPDQQKPENSRPVSGPAVSTKRLKREAGQLTLKIKNKKNNNRIISRGGPVTTSSETDYTPSAVNVQPEIISKDSIVPADPSPVLLPSVIRMNRDSLINTSEALNVPRRYAGNVINRNHKSRKLQWGVNIQGGRTGISKGVLNDLFSSTVVADVNYSFSPGNSTANPGPAMIYIPPSALQPGPGFSAGVYVKKQVSQQISLSVGLQYSRLTTSHKVGNRIDSSLILRQSNSLEQKDIEEYFKTGSSSVYNNRYHFLSVPVTFQASLTNTRTFPVFWDLGLSASRLIATNALHFDGNARIYYKDINLFNRTQVNLQTGFPVGLVSKERFSLKAGPQLEYGITNLITKERSAGKHLLFVGLKAYVDLF